MTREERSYPDIDAIESSLRGPGWLVDSSAVLDLIAEVRERRVERATLAELSRLSETRLAQLALAVAAEIEQGERRAIAERERDEARADFLNACDVGRRQEARAEQAERERDEAREALEDREHAMHMRVRAEYDATIVYSWRRMVARVEVERDEMRCERDEALEALRAEAKAEPSAAAVSSSRATVMADAALARAIVSPRGEDPDQ